MTINIKTNWQIPQVHNEEITEFKFQLQQTYKILFIQISFQFYDLKSLSA